MVRGHPPSWWSAEPSRSDDRRAGCKPLRDARTKPSPTRRATGSARSPPRSPRDPGFRESALGSPRDRARAAVLLARARYASRASRLGRASASDDGRHRCVAWRRDRAPRLARRLARARTSRARPSPLSLRLSMDAKALRRHAPARSAKAAPQGHPAAHSARDPRPGAASRSRAWISCRAQCPLARQSSLGRRAVLRMDLEDFFVSIPAARVYGVFRAHRLPRRGLSGAYRSLHQSRPRRRKRYRLRRRRHPSEIAALYRARQRYRSRHLPQGAPTSPSLANLCAYGMDVRLAAAARAAGATYTRYADDLVFSGDASFARMATRFSLMVAAIALRGRLPGAAPQDAPHATRPAAGGHWPRCE